MYSRTVPAGLAASPLRRRLLPLFLAASAALHAAVVIVVPSYMLDHEQPQARVLEVVLVQTESVQPLRAEPEQAPPQLRRAPAREPARIAAVPEPQRRPEALLPIPASPEAAPAAGPVVPAPRAAEKRLPDPRTDVASIAPSFSAAYLRNPAPGYPVAARRAGDQGTVTLKVLVTREGLPARVDLEKSSGSPRLDAAAMEAVRGWRFVPARQGAETIESWVVVPIVFRLEGAS